MGKVQKGDKNRSNNKNDKKNNKFKQRSAQNMRQLARLDQLTGKNRSQSNDKNNKFDKNKKNDKFGKNNNKFDKFNNNDRENSRNKSYDKGGRSQSSQHNRNNNFVNKGNNNFNKNNNNNKRDYSNNKQRFNNKNNKTKQIGKYKGKNPFENDQSEDSYEELNKKQNQKNKNKLPVIKGNPLFQIIPEGMDDEFAALGQEQVEEENDYQGEEIEEEEFEGEEEDEMFEDEDEQDDDEEGQELDAEEQEEEEEGEDMFEDEAEQDEEQYEEGQEQDQLAEEEGEQLQGQAEQQKAGQQQQQQQADQQQQQQEGMQIQLPDDKQPVDISVLSLKIQQTIQVLMNVQKLGNGKPRKYHLQELKKMIHQYYGYNFELINHFLDFLNPAEMVQFFEANETQRPLTIRTNTLKTRRKQLAQSLIQRGVNLDPLAEWSKVGIKIYQTKVPIGATPQYLAGQYMLQSASSLLPVIALDPQVGEKVLDMASAPGGKTTYIAQLMKNTGSIFANDLKKERLRALQFNLYRLGITNTAVTCRDGRKFPSIFPGTFDRVLLDAPCTGLGIISKDHSIKANRLLIDIYKNSHLQKQLLLAAIDCCKVNGVVVYSTCSVSPLENEEVVNYALKRRFVKIIDCGVQVGEEGLTKFVDKRYHVDLKKTKRIYPHVHNMDGFYVSKLVKIGKGKKQVSENEQKEQSKYQQQHQDNIVSQQIDQINQ